eukprot:GFYU01000133.1.p1 GENE.GFYU01000133.1~~GFYU01000133.1.p1  ORF type:complete len:331 (+),score=87.51 GFYU01000133.1:587-1579(+)
MSAPTPNMWDKYEQPMDMDEAMEDVDWSVTAVFQEEINPCEIEDIIYELSHNMTIPEMIQATRVSKCWYHTLWRIMHTSRVRELFEYALRKKAIHVWSRLLSIHSIEPTWKEQCSMLYQTVLQGNAVAVHSIMHTYGVDPSVADNYAFGEACTYGHYDVVLLLLQDTRVDPSTRDDHGLCKAAACGHTAIVDLLLKDPRVNPGARDNAPLRQASIGGHTDIVQLLLSSQDGRINPASCTNYAIRYAASAGHIQVVVALLKDTRVDPTVNGNEAVRQACRYGHAEVVYALLQHPAVDATSVSSDGVAGATQWAIQNGHGAVVDVLMQAIEC